jgi:hypothetical protein
MMPCMKLSDRLRNLIDEALKPLSPEKVMIGVIDGFRGF